VRAFVRKDPTSPSPVASTVTGSVAIGPRVDLMTGHGDHEASLSVTPSLRSEAELLALAAELTSELAAPRAILAAPSDEIAQLLRLDG
jgi:hypothetical protein